MNDQEPSPLFPLKNRFLRNRNQILKQWVDHPRIHNMFREFGIDGEFFLLNFGEPIFNHYMLILDGKAKAGDCPYMRKMVRYLKEREMQPGEIFVLCNRLRRAFKEILSEPAPEGTTDPSAPSPLELYNEIDNLFDSNLEGVFQIFTETLSKKEREIREYLEIINQNVLISKTDSTGVITHVTDAYCRLTGYERRELLGRTHALLRHPDTEEAYYRELWHTIQKGMEWRGRMKNLNKKGETFWSECSISPLRDEKGGVPGYMSVRQDITDRVRSVTDSLTGLSNRLQFDRALDTFISQAERNTGTFTLILFDIDNFKIINDRHGHDAGDRALLEVSSLVKTSIRGKDLFARWGGEEFVVITQEGIELATRLAERLRMKVEHYSFDFETPLTCSFGVTEYVQGDSPESIFRRADALLYEAKRSGKNKVVSKRSDETGEQKPRDVAPETRKRAYHGRIKRRHVSGEFERR